MMHVRTRWSAIAHHLPKRTDNEIKNYWNTCLKKRLTRMGINCNTHKPIINDAVNLSHMAQWETARLEAEARQVKQYSKLRLQNQPSLTRLVLNKVSPRPSPPPCLDVLKVWQNSWSSSTTSADQNNPRMHSMYAMMLATDDLESPASTLSFPDTVPTNSKCSNSTFGLINQSLLFSSSPTVAKDDGIEKGVSDGEPCGNKGGSFLGDEDDIMAAAAEAFRSSEYNYCGNSMEGLHHDHVLAYDEKSALSPQNLGVISVEEEGQDWESIIDLVNRLPSSPVFPVL